MRLSDPLGAELIEDLSPAGPACPAAWARAVHRPRLRRAPDSNAWRSWTVTRWWRRVRALLCVKRFLTKKSPQSLRRMATRIHVSSIYLVIHVFCGRMLTRDGLFFFLPYPAIALSS